jgi:hypothetical protein
MSENQTCGDTFVPSAGSVYRLRHDRFGQAKVKVLAVSCEWAETIVLSGTLRGMREDWAAGSLKTVRLSHCHWTPVEENP